MANRAVGAFEKIASRIYLEGLAVDPERDTIWYSDVIAGGIHGVKPDGTKVTSFNETRMWTGGVMMNVDGSVLSTGESGIMWNNPETGKSGWLLDTIDGQPINGINEMVPDGLGGIFFGTNDIEMVIKGEATRPTALYRLTAGQEVVKVAEGSRGRFVIGASTANFANPGPDGGLFRLDPDRALTRLDSGIHFSNSPCWSPDGGTFYFSDSWINTTYAYDYEVETGSVSNRRPFVNLSDLGGLPDGATVDADGLYWVAVFRGGKIAAYRPDGKLERVVEMPVPLVSSVGFGGANLDQLYVTTIAHDVAAGAGDHVGDDQAGSLFVIEELGARGRAEPEFAG